MGGYFSYLMRRAGLSEGEESLFCFFPKIKIWQESVGGQFSSIAHLQLLPLFFHCSDFSWLSFTHFHFINKLLENVMAKHVWHKGKSVWRGSIISLNVLA